MFGSTSSFGQSSSSPFGSPSPFGQNNSNPFGSQPGGSIFGGTPTGIAVQSSSPLSSTPAFGAASSPAFGASTPVFGSQSSSFGGSSAFGQKSFGGFGSGSQTSPFGSSFQQSQPAFGSNTFGSTAPFGASSQPSFGGTSTPAFGSSTTPSFGSTSTTGFGPTSTPAFGSTPSPSFGSTGSAFGSTGAFGYTNSSPAFGAPTTSAFGAATSTPSFGSASTPTFGAAGSAPAFGGSTTPSYSFNSTPAFSQSTSAFGSPGFGSTPFGAQGSSGAQNTTPTFSSGTFGQSNLGGSRVSPYQATAEITDGHSNQSQGKLESLSAMQTYKDKSHEELRWEDYQRGDKGGRNTVGQSTSILSSGVSTAVPNPFGSPQTFGQPAANPFSTSTLSTQTNTFTPTPSPFGSTGLGTTTPTLGSSPFSSAPAATTPSLFGSNPAQTPSPFGTSSSSFASSASIFGGTSSSATGSSSIFGPTQGQGQPLFGTSIFGSQSSPLFQSPSPSLGINSSLGQTSSLFGSTSTFTNASSTTSGFSNSSFATGRQLGFSQSTPSQPPLFQPSLPSQTNSLFNFSNAGQSQAGGTPSNFGQSLGQSFGNQSSAAVLPVAITNPFGILPAIPSMSIGSTGTSPSIQYGISSMPVVDKPSPIRVSSLLTSRHLSQRRIRLPARKYHYKNDGSRVAFFSEEEDAPSTPKADALFIPRENPRSLIIHPIDQRPKFSVLVCENGKASIEKQHHLNGYVIEGGNGVANGNGLIKDHQSSVKINHRPTGSSDNNTPKQKGDSYPLSGHRTGEAAITYEHGADVEAAIPKLRHSDYYTEPQIQELAAKERAEPGYCRHVKNFGVGRHGFGSIKFLGETDVRGLDLDTLIQFNDREVVVYTDDTNKPPVGQGLNKLAEVTLLNIKCYDRKTKKQILEGPNLEKYKEMLKKKAGDQGAKFLSYDPAKAEWKFRVDHFSRYVFCDSDRWNTE